MQNYIKFHNHFIDISLQKFICEELENENLIIDKFFWKKNFLKNINTKKNGIINKKFGYKNSIKLFQKFPLHLIYEPN